MAELEVLQFWTEPEDRDGKLTAWSCLRMDGKFFPGVDSLDDPGACIAIPRATRQLVTDKLKSLGRNNTRQLHHGYAAADVEIEVRIWSIEQWRAWLKYLPQIDPARKITKTTKTSKIVTAAGPPAPVESVVSLAPSASTGDVVTITTTTSDTATATVTETKTTSEIPAHSIDHPDLSMLGIASIYITSISTPEEVEDGGVRTIRIKGIEVVKPKTGNKVVSKPVASVGERLNSDADVLPEFKLDTGPRT